jgi:ubiquinone/menaquinone biosynthesis C-methylase UbiE
MGKQQISSGLRRLKLLYLADYVRYYIQKYKNRAINNRFKQDNPQTALPPDYLIYESFSMNYNKYYTESISTTDWLIKYISKYIELKNKKILDWGCGPGRLIRHLPSMVENGCEFYGTDYNSNSIEWCSKNLSGIQFNKNTLEAKLPYPDNYFDVIYGISIFTHLSEQMHYNWRDELFRILKKGGILFITTQGDNFKLKLTPKELVDYNQGRLIVRGNVKEGHRTFASFQPKAFMQNLLKDVEIIVHEEVKSEKYIPQDVWIIRK